jgi:hypothetical protein
MEPPYTVVVRCEAGDEVITTINNWAYRKRNTDRQNAVENEARGTQIIQIQITLRIV